jgi:hypothetical protein
MGNRQAGLLEIVQQGPTKSGRGSRKMMPALELAAAGILFLLQGEDSENKHDRASGSHIAGAGFCRYASLGEFYESGSSSELC